MSQLFDFSFLLVHLSLQFSPIRPFFISRKSEQLEKDILVLSRGQISGVLSSCSCAIFLEIWPVVTTKRHINPD